LRTDQAWQYLYMTWNKQFPKGSATLSSDLKEATDNIPIEVSVKLFRGFFDGVGLWSPLVDICTELLRMPRQIESFHGSFVSSRGVMMGEPLSKVILTLLNLAVEEIAIRKFLNCDFKTPIQVPWRSYAVGGDDHIATGPVPYLKKITETHLRAGSLISGSKHIISNRVVKYCEKILIPSRFGNLQHPSMINKSTEEYVKSCFVDSIKIRLLSPVSKATDVINDRNTAIGKGKSLGRTLKWMNPDHFSPKWIRMVRDRFFQRMGSLLPDRTSGVYWQLILPEHLGGLNLWFEEDLPNLRLKLPAISKTLIIKISRGETPWEILDEFRALLSNKSYRGYLLEGDTIGKVRDFLKTSLIPTLLKKEWWELKQEIDPQGKLPARIVAQRAFERGYVQELDLLDQVLRPFLFTEILQGKEKVCQYNTEPLKKRFAKLWDRVYCGEGNSITLDDITAALSLKPNAPFYLTRYEESFLSDREHSFTGPLDEAFFGSPDLRIKWSTFIDRY